MILLLPPPAPLFPAKYKPGAFLEPARPHPSSRPRGPRRRESPPPPAAVATVSGVDEDAFTKYSGYLFEDGASSAAEFLNEYDFRAISAIYRRKPVLVLRRSLQIGATFGRWFAFRYLDSMSDRSDEMFKVITLFFPPILSAPFSYKLWR